MSILAIFLFIIFAWIMKHLFFLIQGLQDVSLCDLQGQTPFERADTPHWKRLKDEGRGFVFHPRGNSALRTLWSLLTGDFESSFISRSALEAYSLGYRLRAKQRVFCFHFASAGEGVIVELSPQFARIEETRELCKSLNRSLGGRGCFFFPVENSRGILVMDGEGDSGVERLSRRCCAGDFLGQSWLDLLPYREGLAPLMTQASEVLLRHPINELRMEMEENPINALILTDQGCSLPSPSSFQRTFVVSEDCAVQGMARYLGMGTRSFPEGALTVKGLPHFLEHGLPLLFEDYDCLLIDFPQLWRCTVSGHLLEKIKWIECFDEHLVARLEKAEYDWTLLPLTPVDIRKGVEGEGQVRAWSKLRQGSACL